MQDHPADDPAHPGSDAADLRRQRGRHAEDAPRARSRARRYAEVGERIDRLVQRRSSTLGIKQGDRVATFAWNSQEHLEVYMGVPCMGAVLHTLNIRLFPEQLTYIANHAEDRIIFVERFAGAGAREGRAERSRRSSTT